MILSLAEDEAFYTTMQTHTQDVGKKKISFPFVFISWNIFQEASLSSSYGIKTHFKTLL